MSRARRFGAKGDLYRTTASKTLVKTKLTTHTAMGRRRQRQTRVVHSLHHANMCFTLIDLPFLLKGLMLMPERSCAKLLTLMLMLLLTGSSVHSDIIRSDNIVAMVTVGSMQLCPTSFSPSSWIDGDEDFSSLSCMCSIFILVASLRSAGPTNSGHLAFATTLVQHRSRIHATSHAELQ